MCVCAAVSAHIAELRAHNVRNVTHLAACEPGRLGARRRRAAGWGTPRHRTVSLSGSHRTGARGRAASLPPPPRWGRRKVPAGLISARRRAPRVGRGEGSAHHPGPTSGTPTPTRGGTDPTPTPGPAPTPARASGAAEARPSIPRPRSRRPHGGVGADPASRYRPGPAPPAQPRTHPCNAPRTSGRAWGTSALREGDSHRQRSGTGERERERKGRGGE